MYFGGGKMHLADMKAHGDNFIMTHVQDVMPVMANAAGWRQHTDNGWTDTRNMQMIGDIPDVVFFNHPEFYQDDAALRKWLNSDEGQPYRVGTMRHRSDTTKGRIVIK